MKRKPDGTPIYWGAIEEDSAPKDEILLKRLSNLDEPKNSKIKTTPVGSWSNIINGIEVPIVQNQPDAETVFRKKYFRETKSSNPRQQ